MDRWDRVEVVVGEMMDGWVVDVIGVRWMDVIVSKIPVVVVVEVGYVARGGCGG